MQVLGQQDEVVAVVALVGVGKTGLVSDIDFAAENGFEFLIHAPFLVKFAHVVMELLNAKHVAMVGQGHAAHTIGYSLVNQVLDGCHSVKNGIL